MRLGQRVKCVFTYLIHVHRRPARASNYPVPFIVGHCADSLDIVTVSSATSTRHPNTASDLADHLP